MTTASSDYGCESCDYFPYFVALRVGLRAQPEFKEQNTTLAKPPGTLRVLVRKNLIRNRRVPETDCNDPPLDILHPGYPNTHSDL
jgi:hypothetical protein